MINLKKTKQSFRNPGLIIIHTFQHIIILIVISLLFAACNQKEKAASELYGMKVPEGFTMESVVDSNLIDYPMFASFDINGRLFLCESTGETVSTEEHLQKPPYHIRLLEDEDGDGKFEKSTILLIH